MSCSVLADDIDVYNTSNALPYSSYSATGEVEPPNPNYPNVLFVLDASASMGKTDNGHIGTRLQRLQTAMKTVLENTGGVNIGVMRFSSKVSGGRIVYPMSPIEYARDNVLIALDNLQLEYWTPTIGAMLESAFYYRGDPVFYGATRTLRVGDDKHFAERFMRLSHPESYEGGYIVRQGLCTEDNLDDPSCITERIHGSPEYRSPLLSGCQANYQIVLSDGGATNTVDVPNAQALIGKSCGDRDSNTCGVEIAEFLATVDQSLTTPGVNTVITHTVGFNAKINALKQIADAGKGEYFESSSAADLAADLTNIFERTQGELATIAQPAVSVDPASLLSHRKDVYIPLFEPAQQAIWPGNLKGYWLDGKLQDYSIPRIAAIDPATGGIVEGAQSRWSVNADGSSVGAGGAASKIKTPAERTVVTNNPDNASGLIEEVNYVTVGNIDAGDLGLPDQSLSLTVEDAESVVQWTRGVDVKDENENGITTDNRQQYGDPLHTNPVVANYSSGTPGEYDSVVFFGTNDGFLNAIATTTGEDLYSFIPWSLMGNLKHAYANRPYAEKLYGMDGYLSSRFDDADNDGIIDEDSDHFYLYAGMRRGGKNYYALDVSKKTEPELLWTIEGGTGSFNELGQSWSKLQPAKIIHPSTKKITDVLVFSGGYDEVQDSNLRRVLAGEGRSINIVDASTGALIWQAGPEGSSLELAEMKYSIPATPTILDVDGDGILDQIYAADLGGQVLRFDFKADGSTGGGVIATLSNSDVDNKLFFASPDVAVIQAEDAKPLISVSIGSGSRHLPVDVTRDHRFYVIMQKAVHDAPAGYGVKQTDGSYEPITHLDLVDVTDNQISEGTSLEMNQTRQDLAEKHGWYLDLEDAGEKVLNASVTVDHKIIFTSYVPGTMELCQRGLGTNNLYILNIQDGTPVEDNDDDGMLKAGDRKRMLATQGIGAPPSIFFPGGDKVQIQVGTESAGELELNLTQRIYWTEVPEY